LAESRYFMLRRIKQFFESLAYAGLRPSGVRLPGAAETGKAERAAPIPGRIQKLLNGSAAADPLYLSNRTFLRKTRVWLVIGLPAVILLGGLGLVLARYFDRGAPVAAPPADLSDAEIARKMLPDLNKDLHIDSQHDVDVQDVHVVHSGANRLAGVALNNTNRVIGKVEIVFELTDKSGSRQGAVSTQLLNLPAKSSVPFQFAIDQQTASFAIVREVHAQ
jgi:hypothetical protein